MIFNNFPSLKTRIFAGFFLLIIVIFFLGVFSYFSLTFSQKETAKYVETSELVAQMLELDKLSISLNRYIDTYVSYGYENSIKSVADSIDKMRSMLKNVDGIVTIENADDTIDRINEQLNVLENTFKEIVAERNIRTDLLTGGMRDVADSLENQLYILVKDFEKDSDDVYSMIIVLKTIEKNLFRYLDYYDARWLEDVTQNFNILNRWMSENQSLVLEHRDTEFVENLLLNINTFENTFVRFVQSVRSNLYLENVVMSGACHEIIYLSNEFNKRIIDYNKDLTRNIQFANSRDKNAMIVASIAAIFFGVGISLFLSMSISRPIEKITRTFNKLAKGEVNTIVPEIDRNDEIGALARSADVFKAKNSQTEKLLVQTKDLASELELNRQALEKSNDELEQFVYTVSHDLKSPLVTSSGFISMIQDLYKAGKPETAFGKLDKVIAANERMGQLINDLLELSRVGRVDLDFESLDLNLVIREFLEIQKEVLEKEDISLQVEKDLPVIVANKSRFLQVLENLFTNAIKYGKLADKKLEIQIGFKKENDGVSLFFKENGNGIHPEFHKKVFGLFSRLNNSIKIKID